MVTPKNEYIRVKVDAEFREELDYLSEKDKDKLMNKLVKTVREFMSDRCQLSFDDYIVQTSRDKQEVICDNARVQNILSSARQYMVNRNGRPATYRTYEQYKQMLVGEWIDNYGEVIRELAKILKV